MLSNALLMILYNCSYAHCLVLCVFFFCNLFLVSVHAPVSLLCCSFKGKTKATAAQLQATNVFFFLNERTKYPKRDNLSHFPTDTKNFKLENEKIETGEPKTVMRDTRCCKRHVRTATATRSCAAAGKNDSRPRHTLSAALLSGYMEIYMYLCSPVPIQTDPLTLSVLPNETF